MADETTDSATGLSDNPVTETGRDWLGFDKYVAGLAKLLERVETPFVLGVFGDWGVGKTSLMQLLRKKMKSDGHATVWFNPWKHHGREDVWKALVRAVYCEVCERLVFFKFRRDHVVTTLKKAAKPAANLFGRALNLGAVGDEFEGLVSLDSIYQDVFEEGLSERINQLLPEKDGKRLVVFIDDLDRCSPPAIVEVLEALKLYLDIERCVFVLGADEGVVSKVVEHKYGMHEGGETTDEGRDGEKDERKARPLVDGHRYLQKIVQVPFHVPPMDEQQLGEFIAHLVEVAPGPYGVEPDKWDEYLRRVAGATNSNPRQIKRFALTVELLDSIAPDTVSFEREGSVVELAFDRLKLAKLVLLQFVAPAFYDTVKRLPGVLYYRQQQAIEAGEERDREPGVVRPRGDEAADDLLDRLLAEEPLWNSSEEASCYVTVSAGSVAGPRPGGPEDFAQVQKDLLSDDFARVRAAADMVRDRGAEEVQRHVDALLQRLTEDEDASVRGGVARALGAIGHEDAVQPLIRSLTEDKHTGVRSRAAEALGEIGHEDAVQPLTQRLSENEYVGVRAAAAGALGEIGHEDAVQPLIRSLTEDEDWRVRASAARALGKIGHEDAVQLLIRSLTEDEYGTVRWSAAGALGEIGHEDAVQPLIERLTQDEDVNVRSRAAEALGKIGDKDAVPPLIRALAEGEDASVRWRVARALGEIGGGEAEKAIRRASSYEQDSWVRIGIESALRQIEERGGEDTGDETGPEDAGPEE